MRGSGVEIDTVNRLCKVQIHFMCVNESTSNEYRSFYLVQNEEPVFKHVKLNF